MRPDDLAGALRAVRRRLRLSRTVESALKWGVPAALLACVCVALSKFLPFAAFAAAALAALPLAAAWAAAARRVTLFDAARVIDGALRLDERVATAAQVPDGAPMAGALRADAARALAAADARSVARLHWTRESRFLVAALAVLAAIAIAPAPRPGQRALAPALAALTQREAEKLAEAARDPLAAEHAAEMERIAALLRSADPRSLQEAFQALGALESRIDERVRAGGLAPETARALRELAERAAGAGAGLARELAAEGVRVTPLAPSGAKARIDRAAAAARESESPERWDPERLASGVAVTPASRAAAVDALRARGWDARYDALVRRYYEEKP